MTLFPEDTRLIVIRRGELMRVMLPMTQYGLDTTTAPELALQAIALFIQLQASQPGRADLPITSRTGQMALALPDADDVLDEDLPLWAVLSGAWIDYDVNVVGDTVDDLKRFPATVLNLVDLNP